MAIRGKRYYLEFEFWTARQLAEFPKEDICKFIAEKFNEAKKEGKFHGEKICPEHFKLRNAFLDGCWVEDKINFHICWKCFYQKGMTDEKSNMQ